MQFDSQMPVSFFPFIRNKIILHLFFLQIGNIYKRHSLHIDTKKEEVTCKFQLVLSYQRKMGKFSDFFMRNSPFTCFLLACKRLTKRTSVYQNNLFIQCIIIDSTKLSIIQGDCIHPQSNVNKMCLKVLHQPYAQIFNSNIFFLSKLFKMPESASIIACSLLFT